MKKLAFILTILCAFSIQAQNTQPSNFRLNSLAKKEILMTVKGLSSSDVGSMTASDFKIGDGTAFTVNSVSYSGQTLTLTLNKAATYWDNIAVRYEGSNAVLAPFTLSYVENNIAEPATTITKYVTTTATGGGNGDSEATAWTWAEAFAQVQQNTTVWVKAGDYGNVTEIIENKRGKSTAPIKFIGYKNSKKDITTNYLIDGNSDLQTRGDKTYSNLIDNWSTSEMPTLTGNGSVLSDTASRNNSKAITIKNCSYIFFENIQIEHYDNGFRFYQNLLPNEGNHHFVFNNVNGQDFANNLDYVGSPISYGTFINADAPNSAGGLPVNSYFKVENTVSRNSNLAIIEIEGEGNSLIRNVYTYNDISTNHKDATDYHILINGSNNIVTDCFVKNQAYDVTKALVNPVLQHGITIKNQYRWQHGKKSTYNLIQKSIASDCSEAFAARSWDSNYNVFKDLTAVTRSSNKTDFLQAPNANHYMAACVVWGGANNNIFENIQADGYAIPIALKNNIEVSDGNTTFNGFTMSEDLIGNNNIFKNIVATNFLYVISVIGYGDGSAPDIANDNKIINSSFANGFKYIVQTNTHAIINVFNVNNTLFKNILTPDGEMPVDLASSGANGNEQNDKIKFTNCNFWNVKGGSGGKVDYIPKGTNDGKKNIFVDPNLDADLKPTATTPDDFKTGGVRQDDALFDFEGKKRAVNCTIGAYEFGTDTESPKKVTDLSSSDVEQTSLTLTWTASTDDVGVTGYKIFQDDTFLTNVSGDFLSYTVSDLTANTSYNFKVKAFDSLGNESVFSDVLSVTTLSNTTVNNLYTWDDAVSGTNETDVIASGWSPTTAWGYSLSKETDGTPYLKVIATETDGIYGRGYPFNVISGESYRIRFKARVNILNKQNVRVGYDVITTTPALTTLWQQYDYIYVATADESINLDFLLSLNSSATNGDQLDFDDIVIEQVSSSTDTEPPTAITDLFSSTIEETSLALTWTASTDDVGVTGYKIFQDDTFLTNVSGDFLSYTVSDLTANTSYNFKVKAFDAAGNESVFSDILSVTTLSNTTVNNLYTWDDAVSGTNETDVIASGWSPTTAWGYILSKETDDTPYLKVIATKTDGTYGREYPFNVISGESYRIRFKARVNTLNQQNVRVGYDVITTTPALTTSWQQYDYIYVATTDESINLSFLLPLNSSATAGDYIEFDDIIIEQVSSSTDTDPPTAITDLASSTIEETSLTLTWTTPTDNVGVVNYEVFQENISIGSTEGATTFDITGLTAGSTYHFTVYAKDASGNVSEVSNVYEVVTNSLNLYIENDAASVPSLESETKGNGWFFPPEISLDTKNSYPQSPNLYYLRAVSASSLPYLSATIKFPIISGNQYNIKFSAKLSDVNYGGVRVTYFTTDIYPTLTTSWQDFDVTVIADVTGNGELSFFATLDTYRINKTIYFDNIYIEDLGSSSSSKVVLKKSEDATNLFTVYPNPANDSFTIEFSNNNLEKTQITISDVYGRLVYKTETTDNKLKISHNFSHGIYMINIKNNKENVYKKMIIE